jgi:hypothetical protein
MTLRDTELIGKKLVKYGFYRNSHDHHKYMYKDISIEFVLLYTNNWYADIKMSVIDNVIVFLKGHEAVFTPQWVMEEYSKLVALFQFARV